METIASVIPFCEREELVKPTVFALATDSSAIFSKLLKLRKFIWLQVLRQRDADHASALTEFAMLMMCDEMVVTHRSSFSAVAAVRVGRRPWTLERDAQEIYKLSNSQSGHTINANAQHHNEMRIFEVNTVCHVSSEKEYEAARYYFKYIIA
jgi:hypothetical protein